MQPPTPLSEPAQRALEKLQALCPMRLTQYEFDRQSIQLWTACDLDPLLNLLMEKEETHPDVLDERMPYWAELWPSSILMAETIVERAKTLPKGTWVELGCGPGLPGIMAAKTGRQGISSDYLQEALWLSELNAHQNNCSKQISFQNIDWRSPPSTVKADWILAGDVAYESRNFNPLFHTFDQLLLPGGEIWIGEPGRPIADAFFQGLDARGWKKERINTSDPARLFRFTRD